MPGAELVARPRIIGGAEASFIRVRTVRVALDNSNVETQPIGLASGIVLGICNEYPAVIGTVGVTIDGNPATLPNHVSVRVIIGRLRPTRVPVRSGGNSE